MVCTYLVLHQLKSQYLNLRSLATASLHNPLSLLPPCPSLHQIKQSHALITVAGLANNGTILGHLIAALAALSPSPPPLYSLSIFHSISRPNIFAFNNLIRCFAKSHSPRNSLLHYSAILQTPNLRPNNHTFPFVLQACSKALWVVVGVQLHGHVVKLGFERDLFVRNALVSFYGTCRGAESARRVFEEMPDCRDVVTWNAILAGYAREEEMGVAEKVFDEMPQRDVVSWSTMIMGFVQSGCPEKGLEWFGEMRERGLAMNEAVVVSALSASAQLGLLEQGRLVHSTIRLGEFPITVAIGTALVDMYAKCGCIDMSRNVFDGMRRRDVWSWNVMICGLAAHGLAKEALSQFRRFVREGFVPGNVTFVGVLNACSHAGLVDDGRHYFKLMTQFYRLEPEMEHYGCMVDLFARAGLVREALDFVENMGIKPDPVLWATLLGACKIHGLVELGETIGKKLIKLDPTHDGNYVLLSSIHAQARKWDDVLRVRRLMVNRGAANKVAGWSLIEAEGKVHRFLAGEKEHPRVIEIYKMLKVIERRLVDAGYSPDVSPVLHDIGEEEKENAIWEHSERLAIAFGLLVTRDKVGDCIRIVKNLRVCGDCHEVCKMISKVFEREIIVRDGSRFHHFIGGECSCLDYW